MSRHIDLASPSTIPNQVRTELYGASNQNRAVGAEGTKLSSYQNLRNYISPCRWFGATAGSVSLPGLALKLVRLIFTGDFRELRNIIYFRGTNADVKEGRNPVSSSIERMNPGNPNHAAIVKEFLNVKKDAHRSDAIDDLAKFAKSVRGSAWHSENGALVHSSTMQSMVQRDVKTDPHGSLELKPEFFENFKQDLAKLQTLQDTKADPKLSRSDTKKLDLQINDCAQQMLARASYGVAIFKNPSSPGPHPQAAEWKEIIDCLNSNADKPVFKEVLAQMKEMNAVYDNSAARADAISATKKSLGAPNLFETPAMREFLNKNDLQALPDGRVRHIPSGFSAEINLSMREQRFTINYPGTGTYISKLEAAAAGSSRMAQIAGAHGLGRETKHYELSEKLAGAVVDATNQLRSAPKGFPELNDPVISGHSMGGCAGTYAALMHGLTAFVFNPQPLPKVLQFKVEAEPGRLEKNAGNINVMSISGDWLSGRGIANNALRGVQLLTDLAGFGTAKVIGKRYEIPFSEDAYSEESTSSKSGFAHNGVEENLEAFAKSAESVQQDLSNEDGIDPAESHEFDAPDGDHGEPGSIANYPTRERERAGASDGQTDLTALVGDLKPQPLKSDLPPQEPERGRTKNLSQDDLRYFPSAMNLPNP